MRLDVGCGGNKQFSRRVDLRDADVYLDLRKPIIRLDNFVQASAEHLPFRDGFFDEVLCLRTLDQVKNVLRAIKELWRVTNDYLELEVGHRFAKFGKPKGRYHQGHKFSKTYFDVIFKGYRRTIHTEYSPVLTPFILGPRHITVQVWRNRDRGAFMKCGLSKRESTTLRRRNRTFDER